MNWRDIGILDYVNLIANVEQLIQDNSQSTNDDILKALDKQTKVLLNTIDDKLDQSIKNQNEILNLLRGDNFDNVNK